MIFSTHLALIGAAHWIMDIWNPDTVKNLTGVHSKRVKLHFKTRGIILHDRILNQEWNRCF